ncbi:hypothetical protein [Streptomyces sp. SM14]|uniref:hypothetical protein n=1 Tax=Streptomyces sp. SM14 TaxID=1736045 RepID=UPI000CD5130F|nr:hypothetical protein [Streptomyces sp. SM14]
MAHNPQAPQNKPQVDPAGSTQMFQAFVDEEPPSAARKDSGNGRTLMIGVAAVAAVAVVALVLLFAL